ncbi:proline and serine-rich protein 3 isoform 2-T2 [Leptodactylus fuscus]
MKSSVAVFSNQGDPFPTQTRPRTHYHPSSPKKVTEAQKHTVLSPDRLRSLPPHLSDSLSPPDLSFLVGSQRLVPGLPESDSSEPFDESWPSTEDSSKTPERDERTPDSNRATADKQRGPGAEDSVLARYIERFRSGRPTSRRERSPPHSGMKDFWWLQESPDSPEVQRFRPGSGTSAPLESSPHHLERTPTLEDSSLNDSRLCPEDVDIAGLQLRAGKLILRSESSLSSVDPVSSEGLGSSPASNASSSESDRPRRTRPPLLDTAPVMPVPRPNLPSVRAHPTPAPEDDILYQWRLRRKMEQAREGALPVTTRKRSPSPPVRIPRQDVHSEASTDQVYQVLPQGAVQSSCVSAQPHIPITCLSHVPLASPSVTPTSNVPPHLHLLCDVLPCVRNQNAPSAPQGKKREEVNGGDGMAHVGDPPQQPHHTSVPSVPQREDGMAHVGDPPQQPRHTRVPSVPHVKHKEEVNPSTRPSQDGTVHRGPLLPPQQPPERQSKAHHVEEKKVKSKDNRSRRKRDKTEPGEKVPARTMAGPVPESPVHQAMEQVISERLFSPLPSPKSKSEKRERRPSTPSTEDDADLQPVEIAAHLLEDAEESDGTEFADDPLLQVLRDQRAALRSRLWAVDSRLAELEKREQNQ